MPSCRGGVQASCSELKARAKPKLQGELEHRPRVHKHDPGPSRSPTVDLALTLALTLAVALTRCSAPQAGARRVRSRSS